jgi:hypothetical protein
MMKQGNIQLAAGRGEPEVMKMCDRQFDAAKAQRETFEARKAAFIMLRSELVLKYLDVMIGQLHEVQRFLPPALTAARVEMELSIDPAEVEEIFAQMGRRGEAALRRAVAEAGKLAVEVTAAMDAAVKGQKPSSQPPPAPPPPPGPQGT